MEVKLKSFQDGFVFSEAPYPAMVSAWGTGKSLCLILRILRLCEQYPNNLALICRKEFTDLKDSTIKDFELYTGIKVPSSKDVTLPNGSVIMFRHGEELNTLQNINLGVCGIEQAEEFDDDSQWFMLFGRMRRKNCGNPSLFLIANANGDNWINRLWPQAGDKNYQMAPGYELYEATTFDNADVLPESFLKSLETLRVQKPTVYAQYVENSRKVTSGKIFGMWDEKFHVIPDREFPEWWETFGAMDTAVASGVYCAKIYKVSPEGNIIAIKEYYQKGRLISEHCAGIKALYPGAENLMWFISPDAYNKTREKEGSLYSIADELRDNGFNSLAPAENDVNAGINRMGEYLKVDLDVEHPYHNYNGSPRFMVTESCVNTRREIPMYREVPNKISDRGDRKWEPYKKDDHSVDADRYAIMSRPQAILAKEKDKPRPHTPAWYLEQKEIETRRIHSHIVFGNKRR